PYPASTTVVSESAAASANLRRLDQKNTGSPAAMSRQPTRAVLGAPTTALITIAAQAMTKIAGANILSQSLGLDHEQPRHRGARRQENREAGVHQKLIEAADRYQHDAPRGLKRDGQRRRSESCTGAVEARNECSIAGHGEVNARSRDGH